MLNSFALICWAKLSPEVWSTLEAGHLSFRYNLVDASELDGEALLSSDGIGDNVLGAECHRLIIAVRN